MRHKLVRPYISESFLVSIKSNLGHYKICRIAVNKKNDFYIKYSYCLFEKLSFCNGVLEGNGTNKTKIEGNITDTLRTITGVKASHHNSGQVHYQVKIEKFEKKFALKKGLSLESTIGHCFTTQAWGIEAFNLIEEKDIKKSEKRSKVLTFDFKDINVKSFKVIGEWHSTKNLKKQFNFSVIGPEIDLAEPEKQKNGDFYECSKKYIVAANLYQKHVLYLRAFAIQGDKKNDENTFLHFGGFDDGSIINNLDIDSHLIFMHGVIKKLQ